MDLIIPYDEHNNDEGYFIAPNGEFIRNSSSFFRCHEQIARQYCEHYLTPEDQRLLELWINYYYSQGFSTSYVVTDFLTTIKGFDKATFRQSAYLSTPSLIPHIRLYNYYLMGWTVERIYPKTYDEKTKRFIPIEYENLDIYTRRDDEAKEELDLLINGTPLERRKPLLKKPN